MVSDACIYVVLYLLVCISIMLHVMFDLCTMMFHCMFASWHCILLQCNTARQQLSGACLIVMPVLTSCHRICRAWCSTFDTVGASQTLLHVGLHRFTRSKFAGYCQGCAGSATSAAACSAGHEFLYALCLVLASAVDVLLHKQHVL